MHVKNLLKILPFVICVVFLATFNKTNAQETNSPNEQKTYEGVVKEVIEENKNDNGGYFQKLKVEILNHDLLGKTLEVENGSLDTPISQKFKKGDGLVLAGYKDESGEIHLFVSDYIRRGQLLSLFLIFLAVSIIVGGKRGITSFVGMAITFFVIFTLVLPKISGGSNPILIILLFSALAIPITFYLSHGINTKTSLLQLFFQLSM
jgi:uncharacterized membrane protein